MAPAIVAGLLMGAVKAGSGLIEQGQANSLAKRNVRPVFNQSGMYNNLLGMYEQNAQYGIDANSLNFANTNNGNAFTSGLNAMMMAGSDPNMVSNLYGDYSNKLEQLAIADSNMRWQKVNAISNVTDKLYQSKQDEFLYNQDGPFKDAAQLASAKAKDGYKEFMGGLDQIGSSFISGQSSKMYGTTTAKAATGGSAGAATTDAGAPSITEMQATLARQRNGFVF